MDPLLIGAPYVSAGTRHRLKPGATHMPRPKEIEPLGALAGVVDGADLLARLHLIDYPWEANPDRRGPLDVRQAVAFPAGTYRFWWDFNRSESQFVYENAVGTPHVRAGVDAVSDLFMGFYILGVVSQPLAEPGSVNNVRPWATRAHYTPDGGKTPRRTRLWAYWFDFDTFGPGVEMALPDVKVMGIFADPAGPVPSNENVAVDPRAAYARAITASHSFPGTFGRWMLFG